MGHEERLECAGPIHYTLKHYTGQNILRAVVAHMPSLPNLNRGRRTESFLVLVAVLVSLFFPSSCNRYVEKSKYDESQAELAQTKKQLEEAQKQVNDLSAHKFSTYQGGSRTWRFDSATGDTCILLASDADWKRKETKEQSCNCADNRAEYFKELFAAQPEEDRKLIRENWKPILQDACGQ